MKARLQRRYPKDHHNRTRWTWIVRTPTTDGVRCQGDAIGFCAEARDDWRPRAYRARQLPRLTESEARDRLRELQNAVAVGKQDKIGPVEWTAFVETYLAETRGTVRASTLLLAEQALARFGGVCEPASPRDVTRASIKRFIQHERDGGKSTATVAKHISHLRRVWNDQFPDHVNPFVKVAKLKASSKDWHLYTPAEIAKVLNSEATPSYRRRVLYLVAYSTALRKGELANLRWADIDFAGMTIDVNPKANTAPTWEWGIKDHDRRAVPMTAAVKLALQGLRSLTDASPYVFIPMDRYRQVLKLRDAGRWSTLKDPVNNIRRDWRGDCKRAGIPVDAFHSIRKSCITWWLADGVKPHEAQQWAGHSSVQTTIAFYAKVDQGAMDRARKATEQRTAGLTA